MNETCEQTRELLPELALGILGGEDRARALDHLTSCADCSSELAALSQVADGVLTLAPQHEPPAGFEGRVLARLRKERPRHRLRRFTAFAAAAALIAFIAGGAVWVGTGNDRKLASYYEAVLKVQHGKEFAAAALETPDHIGGSEVFTYDGTPSWVFVVVHAPISDGIYKIEGTVEGVTVQLGAVRVKHGVGDWGGTTTAKMSAISEVRVVDAARQVVLRGVVHHE
jgi:hypothetical protein